MMEANGYGTQHERMRRVSAESPCPVCGKTDWCLAALDGSAAICQRVESAKRCGDAGWLHRLRADEPYVVAARTRASHPPASPPKNGNGRRPSINWEAEASACLERLSPVHRGELAHALGLPPAVFSFLRVGFLERGPHQGRRGEACWTFPECDGAGHVVGILCRYGDNAKKAYPGGRRGLTVPEGWKERDGTVFLPEGPSSTAALTALGLSAVGRPQAHAGMDDMAQLLSVLPPERELIVLGEWDMKPDGSWPGKEGAERAARELAARLNRNIHWSLPPRGFKDVRAWVNAQGLDPADVEAWYAAGAMLSIALEQAKQVPRIADATAGAAVKDPSARPCSLDPFRPFPVEALPAPLDSMVRQGAESIGCDPAYIALPILAAVAAAIGNTRTICLKRGWIEPCVVWSAIVADSGTLKGPSYQCALSYLFKKQRGLRREHRQKVERYRTALDEWEDRRKSDMSARPTDPGPGRKVVCGDITIEKLVEILEDNPRGILVAREELSGWLASFTRYKGKAGGTDLPAWLEMFNARAVSVERKNPERPSLFVPHAAVSVTGGIQPRILAKALTPEHFDSGLVARIVMAMPPRRAVSWTELEIDPPVQEAFEVCLDRLLGLEFGRDPDGEEVPHVMPLSPDAKEIWVKFYNDWQDEKVASAGEVAAMLSKLEAYAARFALLHHVAFMAAIQRDDALPIPAGSMEAGIRLTRWFADEGRRIYAILSETDAEAEVRSLVDYIRRAKPEPGKVTVRQLQRSNQRRYRDAEAAQEALDGLASMGLGEWLDLPLNGNGRQHGPPGKCFRIYDVCDSSTVRQLENGQNSTSD